MTRHTMRLVVPVLYALGFVPVAVGVAVVLAYVEYGIGFDNLTTLYANGDVAAATVILAVGGVVFGLIGRLLVWLERPRRPTARDHLRRCALLYVMLGSLGILLVTTYESQAANGASLFYGFAVVCFLIASYAALIDALILSRERRHFDRAVSGGNP